MRSFHVVACGTAAPRERAREAARDRAAAAQLTASAHGRKSFVIMHQASGGRPPAGPRRPGYRPPA